MKIEHTTIEGFTEDLVRVTSEFDHTFVRSEVVRERENAGVESVSVVSGFHDQHYLYELIVPCGEELVGGNGDAVEAADKAIADIKFLCEELKVPHGRGQWQLPQ